MQSNNSAFDFSSLPDAELISLTYSLEQCVDVFAVRVLLDTVYNQNIDNQASVGLNDVLMSMLVPVFRMEDEIKKRKLDKQFQEIAYFYDYSEGNSYSYDAYSKRLEHLQALCSCDILTPESFESSIAPIDSVNEENNDNRELQN